MNYVSIKEASTTLNVSERWLQMLCKQGKILGATRINNQGSWLIPKSWVGAKAKSNKKGECIMKKVSFVYDDVSREIGKKIACEIGNKGYSISTIGEIPIIAHEDEDTIISFLYDIIKESDVVIGISSSGNGIAIYTNKIPGFTAAPISSIEDYSYAVSTYSANAFDISAKNEDIISICINILKGVKA